MIGTIQHRLAARAIFAVLLSLTLIFSAGCAREDESDVTKVKMKIDWPKDKSASREARAIDPSDHPEVGVVVKVTASDLDEPLYFVFSPGEVRSSNGNLEMVVPSGPERKFNPLLFDFDQSPVPNSFPGVFYVPKTSSENRTIDLSGEAVTLDVTMEPGVTQTLTGTVRDDRQGSLMPIEGGAGCANPQVEFRFDLARFSNDTAWVTVDVDATGGYSLSGVPTNISMKLEARDRTTGANTSSPVDYYGDPVDLTGAAQLLLSPQTGSVQVGGMLTFLTSGGIPPYDIIILTNGSGANLWVSPAIALNPGEQANYQAGGVGATTDVIQVTDSCGVTDSTTVSVSWAPLAISPSSISLAMGATTNFTASGGDGIYSWSFQSQGCSMSSISPTGNPSFYDPSNSANCTDVIQLDDNSGSTPATATVTIGPVTNQRPSITSTPPTLAGEEQPFTYNITSNDPEADTITLQVSAGNTCGGIISDNGDGTGTYDWTPSPGSLGTTCVMGVEACDLGGSGGCGTAQETTMTITVFPTYFVDDTATGANDGSSWADAFVNLRGAMAVVSAGDVLFVAEGSYSPSLSTPTDPVLDMVTDVDVYGGFVGTESHLLERGIPADAPTVLDGGGTSYHVVRADTLFMSTKLDGFEIMGGKADSGPGIDFYGGGILSNTSTGLEIDNCYIHSNYAIYGGGIHSETALQMRISNTIISNNTASYKGGGLYCKYISLWDLYIEYVTVSNNNTDFEGGGGMFNYNASPIIRNSSIIDNMASSSGGAMYNVSGAAPQISNTIMAGNLSGYHGGGIFNYGSTTYPQIANCVLSQNYALSGGGALYNNYAYAGIRNSILWGNNVGSGDAEIGHNPPPYYAHVDYSDVEGGYTGGGAGLGIINNDPLFTNVPVFRDYTVAIGTLNSIVVADESIYTSGDIIEIGNDGVQRTVTGTATSIVNFNPGLPGNSTADMTVDNWGPGPVGSVDHDYHLLGGSPCINTGDPNASYNDPDATRNDMGAYGGPYAAP